MAMQQIHGMRLIDMPELPEVETVKRELSQSILGKTFSSPVLYYKPLINTDCSLFLEGIKGKEIISIERKIHMR